MYQGKEHNGDYVSRPYIDHEICVECENHNSDTTPCWNCRHTFGVTRFVTTSRPTEFHGGIVDGPAYTGSTKRQKILMELLNVIEA